ncbi:hypothetical protein X928_09760 [Petrotoga miotherma DSM 10691]|uniref:Uncharacterized protein n=2 Tax=Petrotoga TaxID=28236 RepID=A0A2K1P3Q2_9BACT|nr:hypothetical protein [Petrotoga miotherma]PNR97429.1 hypothetical protein X928_09760 [Petrotoga miotherma DSM 10691]
MKAVLGTPIGSVIIYVKNDKITKIKLTFQKEGWGAGRRGANKNENYYNSKTKKHFDIIY